MVSRITVSGWASTVAIQSRLSGGGLGAVTEAPNAMSVAAYAVARAKGIGGLIGLLLVGLLSWTAGAPMLDVGLRALVGGAVGFVAFWALALQACRHLVVAEARAAARRALERAERAAADAR